MEVRGDALVAFVGCPAWALVSARDTDTLSGWAVAAWSQPSARRRWIRPRVTEVPAQRVPDCSPGRSRCAAWPSALDRLEIRYLTDGDGSLLAMWERHALLFALEGPDDEILVMRGRPHGTVTPDWADRAYRVVNEWNHTRRFCKAYVGDPTERGSCPIYAEIQVPLCPACTTRCWTRCSTAPPR